MFMSGKNTIASGAFSLYRENITVTTGGTETQVNVPTELTLNANSYNPIYGASDTVQPPAIVLIPQIRF